MFNRIILLILLTQIDSFCYGQKKFSLEYVKFYCKKMYGIESIDSAAAYKIDGIYYLQSDSVKREDYLKNLPMGVFFSIEYIKPGLQDWPHGLIMLRTIGNQSRKEIDSLYYVATTKFVDRYSKRSTIVDEFYNTTDNSKDPSLLIDNEVERYFNAHRRINKIRPSDIAAIKIWNFALRYQLLGDNKKNGLVQIWTKKLIKNIKEAKLR